MRGRRRTLASVLAEALAPHPEAASTALVAAFAEACGPRLAREASCRGLTREGRILVVVRTAAWATQVEALGPELCARVNARLRRGAVTGLDVHLASDR